MPERVTTTKKFLFFWGGWPSQWTKSPFVIDNIEYNCCEQFMMAEKARVFGDHVSECNILHTNNPANQKKLGRTVSPFEPEIWNSVCRGIVYTGNLAKYQQNDELKTLLLESGKRTIVEASPRDTIWGIGYSDKNPNAQIPAKWRGKNWLGIALMQVRDELRRQAGLPAPEFDQEPQRQLETRGLLPVTE